MKTEPKVILFVDFLNKDKNHQEDRKYFKGDDFNQVHKEVEDWIKETFDKFDPDWIQIEKW